MSITRYLFLDDRSIKSSSNVSLKLGRVYKHPKNPLMIEDKTWEQRYDNFYGNIIYDQAEGLFKCWYSPFIVANSSIGMSYDDRQNTEYEGHENQEMGICYATSKDGFSWDKPDLNLVDFNGNRSNNIVFRGPHGSGIYYDDVAASDNARYKLIFQGPKTSYSSDGFVWAQPTYLESVKASGDEKITGDTHNNFLWAPTLSKYVAFTRTWAETDRVVTGPESFLNHKWTRQVSRIESADFKKWSNSTVCITCKNWEQQPYAMPVFFHAGIYLGLLAMHDQVTDRVWTELAWSKDTIAWERIEEGTPFIECSDKKLDYDYGCVYACANPVFAEFLQKISSISEAVEQSLNVKLISGGDSDPAKNQVYMIYRMKVKDPAGYAKAYSKIVKAAEEAGNMEGSYGLRAQMAGNNNYYSHYAFNGASSMESLITSTLELQGSDDFKEFSEAVTGNREIIQTSIGVVIKIYPK